MDLKIALQYVKKSLIVITVFGAFGYLAYREGNKEETERKGLVKRVMEVADDNKNGKLDSYERQVLSYQLGETAIDMMNETGERFPKQTVEEFLKRYERR
jgi:hypothetical protein